VAATGKRARVLVGRASELAELDRGLDRLGAGKPWFVQVVGEPGTGKSRLLLELARRAEARGYLVVAGRAAEFEQDLPFAVLREAALSHGEREVAGLVASGRTNKDIAAALYLSEKTIETHLARI
jgi:DNA-binding CsgD family transcriptional regulator